MLVAGEDFSFSSDSRLKQGLARDDQRRLWLSSSLATRCRSRGGDSFRHDQIKESTSGLARSVQVYQSEIMSSECKERQAFYSLFQAIIENNPIEWEAS